MNKDKTDDNSMENKQICNGHLRILYFTLLSAVASIFLTAACALPAWRVDNLRTSGSLYYGLWRICSSSGEFTCVSYVNASEKKWLIASRFLMILSVPPSIISAAFMIMVTYKYIRRPQPIPSSLVAIFAPILSGCLALASIIAFVSEGEQLGNSYGHAFAFGILGTILAFSNLLTYCWLRKKTARISTQPTNTVNKFVIKKQNLPI